MKQNQKPKAAVTTKAKPAKPTAIITGKGNAKANKAVPREAIVKAPPQAAEPVTATQTKISQHGSKQNIIIGMLKVPKGATVSELADATGWQKHSVQGAMSGALKKKLGLTITSEKDEKRGRVYRIA